MPIKPFDKYVKVVTDNSTLESVTFAIDFFITFKEEYYPVIANYLPETTRILTYTMTQNYIPKKTYSFKIFTKISAQEYNYHKSDIENYIVNLTKLSASYNRFYSETLVNYRIETKNFGSPVIFISYNLNNSDTKFNRVTDHIVEYIGQYN